MSSARGQKYCEILILRGFQNPVGDVWSTWGLNDCPSSCWDTITQADAIDSARQMGITQVRGVTLNGPRWWTLDKIVDNGTVGPTGMIDCLLMRQLATLPLSNQQVITGENPPYQEQTIERNTTYTYNRGEPMFVLVHNGDYYVMQSFTTLVDPNLTLNQLPTLGSSGQLSLPSGWSYEVITCNNSDFTLETNHGSAIVIQDNLKNSYQKVNSSITNFNLTTCETSTSDTNSWWWWWILFIILIIFLILWVFFLLRNGY
jgi:hypothetical protein